MCEEKKNGRNGGLAEEAAGVFGLMDPGEYCRFSSVFLSSDGMKRIVKDIRSIQEMMGEDPAGHGMPEAAARARLHLLLIVAENVIMPLGRALLNVCSLKKMVGRRRGDGYEMDDAEKSFGAMVDFLSEYLGRAVQGTHRVPAFFGFLRAKNLPGILHALKHYKFSFVNEEIYAEVKQEMEGLKVDSLSEGGCGASWFEKLFQPAAFNLGPSFTTWFDLMSRKSGRLETIDDYHKAGFLFEPDSKRPLRPNSTRVPMTELHNWLEIVEDDAVALAEGFIRAKLKMEGVGFDVCMWCGKGEITFSEQVKRGICPVCGEMLF